MPQENCVMCGEAITNPVCLSCLEKEMEMWLLDKRASLIPVLHVWTTPFRYYVHRGTVCIICGGNMNVCAHCYTNEIYEMLKERNPELCEEFLVHFNYEIKSPCIIRK